MRNRDDPVDVGVSVDDPAHSLRQPFCETPGPRGRTQDQDIVSGANPPRGASDESLERTHSLDPRDLIARLERVLIQSVGFDVVFEIGFGRQSKFEVAEAERFQHAGVTDIVAW